MRTGHIVEKLADPIVVDVGIGCLGRGHHVAFVLQSVERRPLEDVDNAWDLRTLLPVAEFPRATARESS